jgi:hypothetical protein
MTNNRIIIRFPAGRYIATGWLVAGAVLLAIAGMVLLLRPSIVGFGLIGLSLLLAVFARMAQAQVHQRESLMVAGWVGPECEEAGEPREVSWEKH